jgi:transcriptional regulator with XRE-family HTH domain
MRNIGRALREGRTAQGLTQRDLGEMLGITQAYLSDIEQDRRALGEKHFKRLPDPIKAAVLTAEKQELLAKIEAIDRELARLAPGARAASRARRAAP